jgi:hypothetical protein
MPKRKAVKKRKAVAKRNSVAKSKAVTRPKTAKHKAEDDQDKRIEALKRRVEELGGHLEADDLDDYPVEVEEAFLKHVVDYEEAPWTTNFKQLENAGVSLPAPDSLNDEELTAKLWEVIQKLALLHVFIEQTDHLSDRELYTHLWTDSLREETKAMQMAANGAWHIQILGSCSDEDNQLYLKYYADENWRRQWHKDFPSDRIPPHEDPPYDRDRLLPKMDYDAPIGRA